MDTLPDDLVQLFCRMLPLRHPYSPWHAAKIGKYRALGLYPEILPRTFNLILHSPEPPDPFQWLKENFDKEKVSVRLEGSSFYVRNIPLSIKRLLHKRNGPHLVLQYQTC